MRASTVLAFGILTSLVISGSIAKESSQNRLRTLDTGGANSARTEALGLTEKATTTSGPKDEQRMFGNMATKLKQYAHDTRLHFFLLNQAATKSKLDALNVLMKREDLTPEKMYHVLKLHKTKNRIINDHESAELSLYFAYKKEFYRSKKKSFDT